MADEPRDAETEQEMATRHRNELMRSPGWSFPRERTAEEKRELSKITARQARERLAWQSERGKRPGVAILRAFSDRAEEATEEHPTDYNRGVRDALRYALGTGLGPRLERPSNDE